MSKRLFAVVGALLMTTALALPNAGAFSLWGSSEKPEAAKPAPGARGSAAGAGSTWRIAAQTAGRRGETRARSRRRP